MDEAHEGGDCFLAAQGDPAEAFEFVEEAFDLMAFLVEPPVDRRRGGAAGIGVDLGGCAEVVGNESAQRISIVSCVGDDMANALQTGQEGLRLWAVAILSGRRMDPQRQADRIDGRVQLGRQSAARATDGGSFSPPFAPVASAWTFEIVLSIRTYSKSGVSARAWKSPSQTPLRD